MNESIRAAFIEYLGAYPEVAQPPEDFVFFNIKTHDCTQPIKRGQAWKFMRAVCGEIGLPGNYGTHNLRKTWGYHARQQGVDLALTHAVQCSRHAQTQS